MLKDMNNLRVIYQGIMGYAGENGDRYPAYAGNESMPVHGFDSKLRIKDARDQLDLFEVGTNNITAALWLMVREDHLPVNIFASPARPDTPDHFNNSQGEESTQLKLYDFSGPQHLSYSSVNFYHPNVRSKWSYSMGPRFIPMANDNASDFSKLNTTDYTNDENNTSMNSPDLLGKGQHVQGGDGSAEFIPTPVTNNPKDNIYTWKDKDGGMDDTLSMKALKDKTRALINSMDSEHTVLLGNRQADIFLLPVESLVMP